MVGAVLTADAQASLMESGAGIINIRLVRPFLESSFLASLPKTVKHLSVIDFSLGNPTYANVCASFHSGGWGFKETPLIVSSRLSHGSSALDSDDIHSLLTNLAKPEPSFDLEISGCARIVEPPAYHPISHANSPYTHVSTDRFSFFIYV